MRYQILGQEFQVLNVWLEDGEKFLAEAGAMTYMSGNVKMEARAIGGISGALKRVIGGSSAFLVEFTSEGSGFVAFSRKLGRIFPVQLNTEESIIAQKHAYLASTPEIDISITFVKKFGAGLFGGEGFILQKITSKDSNQIVFIEACGQLIEITLQNNQVIKVDPGNIVAFDVTVDYDIQRAGDIKTMLFGGEGLFLAKLTGPGRVWLQSTNLADLINSFRVHNSK